MKFLILALFTTLAFADNRHEGPPGSDGDSYGAGFGLIDCTYDIKALKRYSGCIGGATFDGEQSYKLGIGKAVPHGYLTGTVAESDGETGGSIAWGFKFP